MGIIQGARGYRFSLDAVLLARFAAEWPAEVAVDLGSGSGVVALCLRALGGAGRVLGIELQGEAVERAMRSARWNRAEERVSFARADLKALPVRAGSVGLAVGNPPYRPLGAGKVSSVSAVALARHEVASSVADLAAAGAGALARGGSLCLVYPAERLGVALSAAKVAGLEPRVLRFLHPCAGRPASLALVRAVKGAREGLEVRSPLFLHGPGERYTPEATALLGPP